MREKKKGRVGIAANYVTRTQAVKRLHISLKDFRRLCILKGIFPRDPKKKAKGRGKTYYHVKDLQFLAHEPLLMKFRALKTFLRKYKKANMERDKAKLAVLRQNRPKIVLDHLIKERYPTFVDALRDLDDPLSMANLFALLPSKIIRSDTSERAAMCARLANEFSNYVVRTHGLNKVFVSIKGIYYQAEVQGQLVTWLVPHQFNQVMPEDVDFRIMLTFLSFYETLLKFVNFKLYHDMGLHYPPLVDAKKDAQRAGIAALRVMTIEEAQKAAASSSSSVSASSSSSSSAAPVTSGTSKAEAKDLQKTVNKVISKLGTKADKSAEEAPADEDKEAQIDSEEFAKLSGQQEADLSPAELEAARRAKLFEGCLFLLARETPADSLDFVIASAGGKTVRELDVTADDQKNSRITHQVVDRPPAKDWKPIPGRIYVQPQWVYDSFNCRALLPSEPYAPGVVPPPHLSPFVDDEAEGYVPKQREVLKQWGAAYNAQKSGKPVAAAVKEDLTPEEEEDEEDMEARYQRELQEEQKGVTYSEAVKSQAKGKKQKSKKASNEDEADDGEEESGDEQLGEGEEEDDEDEDESGIVPDSDDEEEGEEEETAQPKKGKSQAAVPAPAAAQGTKRKRAADAQEEEKELAKIMMSKKDARLYRQIQHSRAKKAEKNEALVTKRAKIEQQEKKQTKASKKSTKKSA